MDKPSRQVNKQTKTLHKDTIINSYDKTAKNKYNLRYRTVLGGCI